MREDGGAKKEAAAVAVFARVQYFGEPLNRGSWVYQTAENNFCPFSLAAVWLKLQELCISNLLYPRLPVAAASGVLSCLSGLYSS